MLIRKAYRFNLSVSHPGIIGNPHSSIFDSSFTQVSGGRFLKTLSWYDNEWGYSNRVCDVLGMMAQFDQPQT